MRRLRSPRRWAAATAVLALIAGSVLFAVLSPGGTASAAEIRTFTCKGGGVDTYVVPPDVTAISVLAAGAQGSNGGGKNPGAGGPGSSVAADIKVTPGETLSVYVGCSSGAGGFSGGSGGAAGGLECSSAGGAGGGTSNILRSTGAAFLQNVVVAAGGGGGGGTGYFCSTDAGGTGGYGGDPGETGHQPTGGAGGGLGGGQSNIVLDPKGGAGTNGGGGGGGGGAGCFNGAGGSGSLSAGGGGGGGGQSCVVDDPAVVLNSKIGDPNTSPGGRLGDGIVTITPHSITATAASVKNADPDDKTDNKGDVITFTWTVTNQSFFPVDLTAGQEMVVSPTNTTETISCPVETVGVGESTTCTASHTLSQVDVDSGKISADATFTGQIQFPVEKNDGIAGRKLNVTATAHADYNITESRSMGAELVADQTSGVGAGDAITYRLTVSNTGNTNLKSMSATIKLTTLTAVSAPIPMGCSATTLAPDVSLFVTCTYKYTIQAADVNGQSPKIDATATVTATSARGTTFSKTSNTVTTTLTQTKSMTATMSASAVFDNNPSAQNPAGVVGPGDSITYRFTIKNTGDVTLNNLVVGADKALVQGKCPTTLVPGQQVDCIGGNYNITQADINAGSVVNTGHVQANVLSTNEVVKADTNPTTTPITAKPGLTLVKAFTKFDDANNNTIPEPGDVLHYTITATNSGNVTLTNVTVDDVFDDPAVPSSKDTLQCPTDNELTPGASYVCTRQYTVKQADVDHGSVTNNATVQAQDQTGKTVRAAADPVTEVLATISALSVNTTAAPIEDTDHNQLNDVGETIDYTVVITNVGGVTLSGVNVTDVLGVPGAPELKLNCDGTLPADLAPAAKITCTASYTLTQADLDRGEVVNTATATGKAPAPAGTSVTSGPSAVTTKLLVSAKVAIAQSATVEDRNTNAVEDAGDYIVYSITVTNGGNQTLTDSKPVDLVAGTDLTLTCNPGSPAVLAPKAEMDCRGSTAITAQMAAAGGVEAQASVTASPPAGDAVNAQTDLIRTPLGSATGGGGDQAAGTAAASGTAAADAAKAGTATKASNNAKLAYTGVEVADIALVAVLAIASGGGLLVVGRVVKRRRRRGVRRS
ncbi:hypothetical protein [Amycolatopsis sp. cmx-4-61]|uniref:DUF7507 domain-containing protein n=1 Tax=Amycolatopsis sp. cmx-4-61 TaxID=2790937 RepID=UPI003978D453